MNLPGAQKLSDEFSVEEIDGWRARGWPMWQRHRECLEELRKGEEVNMRVE